MEEKSGNTVSTIKPAESYINFNIQEKLGEGSFGNVYIARKQNLAENFVIKFIGDHKIFQKEKRILCKIISELNMKGIIRLLGYSIRPIPDIDKNFLIFKEEGPSLRNFIKMLNET